MEGIREEWGEEGMELGRKNGERRKKERERSWRNPGIKMLPVLTRLASLPGWYRTEKFEKTNCTKPDV